MSRINLRTKIEIQKKIQEFIKKLPREYSVEPNCRSGSYYIRIMRVICKYFCSSPLTSLLEIKVGDKNHIVNGQQSDIDNVPNLKLHDSAVKSIRKTLKQKKGIGVVYVIIQAPEEGHACLMIFDAQTRKQHFFNPWGYTTHWLQKAIARRDPFVPGFEVANEKEDAWSNSHQSLQTKFDKIGICRRDDPGNCGVYVTLIVVLCLRFGIGHPKLMATLFMSACELRHKRVMTRIWSWMESLERPVNILNTAGSQTYSTQQREILRQRKKAALQELTQALFHWTHNTHCWIYCPSSGRLCQRKPCPEDVFCWQHRFYIKNKDKTGKHKMKCSASQAKCKR